MFEVLMFVCAINIPSSQCDEATAFRTVRGPMASDELHCGLQSQAFFAQTAFAQNVQGTYLKIRCARSKPADVATRKPTVSRSAVTAPSPMH